MKKACFAVASFLFSIAPSLAPAQTTDSIDKSSLSQCQAVNDGASRLACYDKLLPPTNSDIVANSDSELSIGIGKWDTATEKSPVDDSQNVYLVLKANEPVRGLFGDSVIPSLFITCREKKINVFINWEVYLGLQETSMLYRLDKQKAVTMPWTISTNTKAVFYRGQNVDFIKKLSNSNNLFVQITPYGENSVSTTFDLKGLSEAIKPLQKACRWN
ncbi:type VI secretion system-associated protein TagO [Dickeya oryzae]|uniref:Type VI secretion system-associated protein TagO n=1 Tax=Dickeya oryzae TaxID=1240404 RepID=A0AB39ILI2_9GAMM|nr:type VI secretion system-associated protein TagO [Dickeya oryzae]MCA6997081.1 type VI secretion protein [Dickeya oryzae]